MIDFDGISLPFNVSDLVGSGSNLLGIVGAFVLLGLAFVFVPILINLIRISIGVSSDNKINADSPRHKQSHRQAWKKHLKEDRFYRG